MSRLFVILQYLLPHHLLSRLTGMLAQSSSLKKPLIKLFVRRYRVDLSEALISDIEQFENFNDFFTRELKPGARPVASGEGCVISPADGAISQSGAISEHGLLQAKGRHYTVSSLLGGDESLASLFSEGSFATVYLSPRDYHRVHMPLAGRLLKTIYVPGRLFSVNKVTAENVPNLFARNERLVCLFETEAGPMALVLVGAMIVAGIETVWAGQVCPRSGARNLQVEDYVEHNPPIELATGTEVGRFKLGSTAIVLFGHGAIELDKELIADSPVRMGQALGTIVKTVANPTSGE